MLFDSYNFAFFFLLTFLVSLALAPGFRNFWLLLASYAFYALWDVRFPMVLAAATALTYVAGNSGKKSWRLAGIAANLAALGFFKYYNFFLGHFTGSLDIMAPVGISFYTFKSVSYLLDIDRGQLKPVKKITDLALYLAFFPQLIAGPIDRAADLLPQIETPRKAGFEKIQEGAWFIFWGLFLKGFAADNLGAMTAPFFAAGQVYSTGQVLINAYAYTWQLYCDFAGYSMIAWGLAAMLGFQTTHNFDQPLWSLNIQGFWNRWHISLSRWIRDYLYTPVFLSARFLPAAGRLYFATLVSMFCIGLWHGAAWHYVLFGVYHGIWLCLYAAARPWLQKNVQAKSAGGQAVWFWVRVVFMFHVIAAGFLIFRAQSCSQFFDMMAGLLNFSAQATAWQAKDLLFYIFPVLLVEIAQLVRKNRLAVWQWNVFVRAAFYVLCFFFLSVYGAGGGKEFIYFQF